MLSISYVARRIFLIVVTGIVFFGTAEAGVLFPPNTVLPIAEDVKIDRYVKGQPLKLFSYSGRWEVVKDLNELSIIGTSDEAPIHLISIDKLSKKPKSLKIDFIISDKDKEYGFIYGDIGVIVRNNMIYSAFFDNKTNKLSLTSQAARTIVQGSGKINTLQISTGYDPLGGVGQTCTIYVNNRGITFKYNNMDNQFGVYVGPKNIITINNIRWGVGSK